MSALRLALGDRPGHDQLDGAWWPYSRSFAEEFAQLVEESPPELGRIVRAQYSPADWDDAPRRVNVGRGYVKVGHFPRDDTHVIYVTTSDRLVRCLLVVPSDFNAAQGEEALLAASTSGNRHAARDLLHVVTDAMAVDPGGIWQSETTA